MPRQPTVINPANPSGQTYASSIAQQQAQTKYIAQAYVDLHTAAKAATQATTQSAAAITKQTTSTRNLSATMQSLSTATLAASAAVGATMLGFEKHFSPSTWHRFELRVGDFAAVMGEVLHPAFVKMSDTLYSVSKYILNLSPATKKLIADLSSVFIPFIIGTTLFTGLATVMRSAWITLRSGISLLASLASLKFGSLLGIGSTAGLPASTTAVMHVTAGTVTVIGGGGRLPGTGGAGGAIATGVVSTGAAATVATSRVATAEASVASTTANVASKVGWMSRIASFGAKALRFVGWIGVAIGVIELVDSLMGSPISTWIGKKLSGSPDTKSAGNLDPTNRDAFRQVRTMNSVLEAGQLFRERSLFYTDKQITNEQEEQDAAAAARPRAQTWEETSGRWGELHGGTVGGAFEHLLQGGLYSDSKELLKHGNMQEKAIALGGETIGGPAPVGLLIDAIKELVTYLRGNGSNQRIR